jgi:hypothetical protein
MSADQEHQTTITDELKYISTEATRLAAIITSESVSAASVHDFARHMRDVAERLRKDFGAAARSERETERARVMAETAAAYEAKQAAELEAYKKTKL